MGVGLQYNICTHTDANICIYKYKWFQTTRLHLCCLTLTEVDAEKETDRLAVEDEEKRQIKGSWRLTNQRRKSPHSSVFAASSPAVLLSAVYTTNLVRDS